MGLNIALSPNLIGSSDADFYKDSESGLNSKIKKNTKESFVHFTVDLFLQKFKEVIEVNFLMQELEDFQLVLKVCIVS